MFSANVEVGMKNSFISYIYTLYTLAKPKVFKTVTTHVTYGIHDNESPPFLLMTRILIFLSRVIWLTEENYGSA